LGLNQASNFTITTTGLLEGKGDDPLLEVGCNLGEASALMRHRGADSVGGLNWVDTLKPDVEKSGYPAPGVEAGRLHYTEVRVLCIHVRRRHSVKTFANPEGTRETVRSGD
jgi:hypothetical protein